MPPKYASKCLYSRLLPPAASAGIKLPSIAFPLRANLGVETDPALRLGLATTVQQDLEKQEGAINMFFAHDGHPPCVCHNSRQVHCPHWNRRTVGSPGHSQVRTPRSARSPDKR